MRTLSILSLAAGAMAIKLQTESTEDVGQVILDGLTNLFISSNTDGVDGLSEDEFLAFVTVLDEDQNLTADEKDFAISGYQSFDLAQFESDPYSFVIWLTDYISSTASGEDFWMEMSYDDFMEFTGKLGLDANTATEAFNELDFDQSGALDL